MCTVSPDSYVDDAEYQSLSLSFLLMIIKRVHREASDYNITLKNEALTLYLRKRYYLPCSLS